MSRLARLMATGVLGGKSPWWLAGGVVSENCVAVYQPMGAPNLLASYSNLASPGLFDSSPHVAPTWNTSDGWIADGSKGIKTQIVPKSGWSAILKFSSIAGSGSRHFFGEINGASLRFGIGFDDTNIYFYSGGTKSVSRGGLTSGILAIAGQTAYINGVAQSGAIGNWVGDNLNSLNILGVNDGTNNSYRLNGNLQCLAIYKTVLTPLQISKIGERLNNPCVWGFRASKANIAGVDSKIWSFNNSKKTALAGGNTYISPGWSAKQDSAAQYIVVDAPTINGSAWKLKTFRYDGVSSFEYGTETSFTPTVAGISLIKLSSPLTLSPGDVVGLYVPADNSVNMDTTGVSRIKLIGSAAGDITTDNEFATKQLYSDLRFELIGESPLIAVTGDSIMEGEESWVATYNTAIAGIESQPGGDPLYEPMNILRAKSSVVYQNHAMGEKQIDWVASTGIVAAASVHPSTIIIEAGTNDITASRTWAQVEANLNTILAYCASAGVWRLMICEILPRTGFSDANAAVVRTWNGNLATWCAANGVTLILCHDALGQVRASTGQIDDLKTEYNKGDNVHLSVAGVDAFATIIASYI